MMAEWAIFVDLDGNYYAALRRPHSTAPYMADAEFVGHLVWVAEGMFGGIEPAQIYIDAMKAKASGGIADTLAKITGTD